MWSRWQIMSAVLLCYLSVGLVFHTSGQTEALEFNEELAKELGADDYGMRNYTLVILRTGPQSVEDKDFVSRCFRGHMENINRLVDEGILIMAGPLGKNDHAYRGIFILTETDADKVKVILQTDPAIREQLLEAETYNWYGSAALPLYLSASRKIVKKKP
jgi:uncharacterized protein